MRFYCWSFLGYILIRCERINAAVVVLWPGSNSVMDWEGLNGIWQSMQFAEMEGPMVLVSLQIAPWPGLWQFMQRPEKAARSVRSLRWGLWQVVQVIPELS